MAVVTSADADHLDIYGDHDQMLSSYRQFVQQIKGGGTVVIHESVQSLADKATAIEIISYGRSKGKYVADNINVNKGFFEFDAVGPEKTIAKIQCGVPGFHNVENALAATIIALKLGISEEAIRKAIGSFQGVKRRFEFIIKKNNIVFIDDYAHHPAEIEAFLKSVKSMYAGRKVTVIFQPHLFTRTRDFAPGFSQSLSLADELVLLDIYPAREEPIPGVTSDMLMENIQSPVKIRANKKNLLHKIEEMKVEVLVTVGAGDIDTLVKPIQQMLNQKYA
jgi:UDP-N-acetylmuramate--alanine ligase